MKNKAANEIVGMHMKARDVVGALICKDGKVLLAQRSCQDLNRKWEFPGGKVESTESHQEALRREIAEELGITIEVERAAASNSFCVRDKSYRLCCYWARIIDGVPSPNEHYAIAWVPIEKLLNYDLAPADIPIAKEIMSHDRKY